MSLLDAIAAAPVPDGVKGRLYRAAFNLHPAYRGTGGRVTHVAPDWSEIRVKIPHSWRTKNPMGTIFGGSLYGAVDPMYTLMLRRSLGDGYAVWDKAAEIRFLRPGEETLYGRFTLPDGEIEAVRSALGPGDSTDRVYEADLVNADGTVHASVEKTVHVSRAGE